MSEDGVAWGWRVALVLCSCCMAPCLMALLRGPVLSRPSPGALYCGSALWPCRMALYCGAALWPCTVALCCALCTWLWSGPGLWVSSQQTCPHCEHGSSVSSGVPGLCSIEEEGRIWGGDGLVGFSVCAAGFLHWSGPSPSRIWSGGSQRLPRAHHPRSPPHCLSQGQLFPA